MMKAFPHPQLVYGGSLVNVDVSCDRAQVLSVAFTCIAIVVRVLFMNME